MMYDLEKHERCSSVPLGLTGQISFERLAKLFETSGELKPGERITHFRVTERGMIQFILAWRKEV